MKYKLQVLKSICLLLLLASLSPHALQAQETLLVSQQSQAVKPDNNKVYAAQSKTLKSVLIELESKLKISLNYDYETVAGKQVNTRVPENITESAESILKEILDPLQLGFEKLAEDYYIIFQKEIQKDQSKNRKTQKKQLEKQQRLGLQQNKLEKAQLQAQVAQVVSGTVTTPEGEALPGVNIAVKETTIGTITDIEGKYSLDVPDGKNTLIFSYIGFLEQEVTVDGRSQVDVVLQEDVGSLEEVVVVGYGTVQKKDLTGSVSQLKGDDLTAVPSQSPLQALQGKVTGVQVTSASGEPGAAPRVLIRGVGTFGGGDPLYVVDGTLLQNPTDVNFINNNDIESIEVLKDASAAAIYGARGANGVIIITTKQGKAGKPKINVDVNYGLQYVQNKIDLLNGPQYAQLVNEALPGTFADPNNVPNTDWQDLVFDEPAGLLQANLSVSGASDRVKYYASFGYFEQEGVVPTSKFRRYTLRLNNSYYLNDNLEVGHNFTLARTINDIAPNVTQTAFRASPAVAPFTPDGKFSPLTGTANPLASLAFGDNQTIGFQGNGSVYGELTVLKDIKVRSSFGVNAILNNNENFVPVFEVSPQQRNEISSLSVTRNQDITWFWENTVTYFKRFGAHQINAVAGFTMQENYTDFLFSRTQGLVREELDQRFFTNGVDTLDEVNSNGVEKTIASFLFRVNYTLLDKYTFTFTSRVDGSSVFAQDNQYGFFPAIGLGWVISEEDFLADNSFVNFLKLRGSWGILGNDRIDGESRFSVVNAGINAVFGPNESLIPGVALGNIAFAGLIWEETTQWDIGLEFQVLDNRLRGEIDYYYRNSDDILTDINVPAYTGATGRVTFNTAEVVNQGFEFNINWQDEIGDFSYGLGVLGTTISNEVQDVGGSDGRNSFRQDGSLNNGQLVTRTEAGQPISSFYGYQIDGVFQNEQELEAAATLANQGVGDFRYVDRNGDGVISDDDRTFIGSPIPDFIYGFNVNLAYKGFDLSLDFQGQAGNEIYNGKRAVRPEIYNYQDLWLDRWTPDNPSNSVPRASTGGPNFEESEFFVEDGSFLRLRTLTLGYNFPKAWIEKAKLTQARIYLRGTNVFTSTDYTGYTPEIAGQSVLSNGIDLGVYPVTSIYTLGANLTF